MMRMHTCSCCGPILALLVRIERIVMGHFECDSDVLTCVASSSFDVCHILFRLTVLKWRWYCFKLYLIQIVTLLWHTTFNEMSHVRKFQRKPWLEQHDSDSHFKMATAPSLIHKKCSSWRELLLWQQPSSQIFKAISPRLHSCKSRHIRQP